MNYRTYRAKKWLLRHKKDSALVLALCFLFGLPWVINSSAIVGAAATQRELPIYCVDRDNKCASLTFDAAWGNIRLGTLITLGIFYLSLNNS